MFDYTRFTAGFMTTAHCKLINPSLSSENLFALSFLDSANKLPDKQSLYYYSAIQNYQYKARPDAYSMHDLTQERLAYLQMFNE
jgi:hypothetical protein